MRSRLLLLTAVLFAAMAVLSWWTVVEEGPSPARVIAGIATTAGAFVQIALRKRGARRGRLRG